MTNAVPDYTAWTNGVIVRRAQPRVMRLFCLPYAGGGASIFRHLRSGLAPAVDVYAIQLPGRESRWHEAALTSMAELVRELDTALAPMLDDPYVLFGHSMGAFIAFELARKRRRDHRPGPRLLIASAARAPQIPDPDPPLHREPSTVLVAEVKRHHGIPREVLEHPEFVALLLPTLRADLEACETYCSVEEPPLECPMVVYCGEQDEKVRSVDLAAWRLQTTAGFRLRSFPGNHFFFLNESRDRVTQAIAEDVARVAGENGPLPLEAGRPQLEAAIAGVWRDVLGTANVGLDDNFFDLGGNSVLMLEVHAHLRRTVGMTLPVLDLFQYPTVRLLAGKLQSQPGRPATAWGNVDIRRAHPPSDRASEEKRP